MKKIPARDNKTTMTTIEVGVLLEDIRGDIKILGEGQMALTERVDKLDKKFDGMGRMIGLTWDKISMLAADVSVLKTDVGEMKIMLGGHDKRLVKLEEPCLK